MLLRVNVVAEILGVYPQRVYELIKEGDLEVVRMGPRLTRVKAESLAEFIRHGGVSG